MFVDDPADVPPDATALDMRGADLSHHAGDCSFETILRRYGWEDPVLCDVAGIVHEAGLDDDRCEAPEVVGVDAVWRGLSMLRDDAEILAVATAILDGPYEHRRRALSLERDPA